jgi:hypothetical protein
MVVVGLPLIMPRQSSGDGVVAIFMDFPQLRSVLPSEVRCRQGGGRPATSWRWWCRCLLLRTTRE